MEDLKELLVNEQDAGGPGLGFTLLDLKHSPYSLPDSSTEEDTSFETSSEDENRTPKYILRFGDKIKRTDSSNVVFTPPIEQLDLSPSVGFSGDLDGSSNEPISAPTSPSDARCQDWFNIRKVNDEVWSHDSKPSPSAIQHLNKPSTSYEPYDRSGDTLGDDLLRQKDDESDPASQDNDSKVTELLEKLHLLDVERDELIHALYKQIQNVEHSKVKPHLESPRHHSRSVATPCPTNGPEEQNPTQTDRVRAWRAVADRRDIRQPFTRSPSNSRHFRPRSQRYGQQLTWGPNDKIVLLNINNQRVDSYLGEISDEVFDSMIDRMEERPYCAYHHLRGYCPNKTCSRTLSHAQMVQVVAGLGASMATIAPRVSYVLEEQNVRSTNSMAWIKQLFEYGDLDSIRLWWEARGEAIITNFEKEAIEHAR
ncbi:hypothetical protein MMC21_007512 [Puttea exsequens]|nr:hypothetical protein [Puttea exsequens]